VFLINGDSQGFADAADYEASAQKRTQSVRRSLQKFSDLMHVRYVDVARLGSHDHVVGPGDVFRLGDALELGNLPRHGRSLADLGLDEDEGLDHGCSSGRSDAGRALAGWRTSGPARA